MRLQSSTGTAASAKTNFLWDVNHALPQLALERNGSGVLQRRYTYGLSRLRQANGTASYYAYDALGSVAGLLSNSGGAQRSWSYEPYGPIRTSSGTSPTNFLQFTGEYLDPTALYHLRARQYDPASGRFLELDPLVPPLEEPSISSYVYASDQPTRLIDPLGEGVIESDAGTASSTARNVGCVPGSTIEYYQPVPAVRIWRGLFGEVRATLAFGGRLSTRGDCLFLNFKFERDGKQTTITPSTGRRWRVDDDALVLGTLAPAIDRAVHPLRRSATYTSRVRPATFYIGSQNSVDLGYAKLTTETHLLWAPPRIKLKSRTERTLPGDVGALGYGAEIELRWVPDAPTLVATGLFAAYALRAWSQTYWPTFNPRAQTWRPPAPGSLAAAQAGWGGRR